MTKQTAIQPQKKQMGFLATLALALFCAGIIRSFIFEPFHIPSGSMKPNLLIGDYIIVTKYSYGYSRYSFPFGFKIFDGRVFSGEQKKPRRGDVIVFRLPSDPSINYIKRVVGLPGDAIQMRDGVLYINDKMVKKESDGMWNDIEPNGATQIEKYVEEFSEGKKITTIDTNHNLPQDNTGIYHVPEGSYFVMGDNRDNSQDSRFLSEVGFVPEENLIGKARFVFFSTSRPVWQFWHWFSSVRTDRIFKKID